MSLADLDNNILLYLLSAGGRRDPVTIVRLSRTCKKYYTLLRRHPLVEEYKKHTVYERIVHSICDDVPVLVEKTGDWERVLSTAARLGNDKYIQLAVDHGACNWLPAWQSAQRAGRTRLVKRLVAYANEPKQKRRRKKV